jgi:hypothetical protein
MLSNRACGEALRVDDDAKDVPAVPVRGGKSRGAAQSRMRELLSQDRALLALRREAPDADLFQEPPPPPPPPPPTEAVTPGPTAALELAPAEALAPAATRAQTTHAPAGVFHGAVATVARGSCTGVATSFEPLVPPASPGNGNPEPPPVVAPEPAVPPVAVAVAAPVAAGAAFPAPVVHTPAPATSPARGAAAGGDDDEGDPIRTRSMAKLLAMQGYRDRALSIYDELIAAEPDNASLRAEADRLRG